MDLLVQKVADRMDEKRGAGQVGDGGHVFPPAQAVEDGAPLENMLASSRPPDHSRATPANRSSSGRPAVRPSIFLDSSFMRVLSSLTME
jgi:hypothetical protein